MSRPFSGFAFPEALRLLAFLSLAAAGCASSGHRADEGPETGPSGHEDASACDGSPCSTTPTTCNGSASNCDLRYDQVTWAATHNAYSYAAGGPVKYAFPNQDAPIPDQLAYGIRALGIRPCPYYGTDPTQMDRVYVTHNTDLKGALGTEPLEDILVQVRTFLEDNPGEVVTLLAESAVTPDQVAHAFDLAGLVPYLYTHDSARGWPTLRDMATEGTRLVVFNDSQEPTRPAWQHYMWDLIVDTDYNVTTADQFTCEFYRGEANNDLYFINQFIYADLGGGIVVPDKNNALIANDRDFVFSRAVSCWREKSRIPNYVYVDWYGQGDVIGAVRCLNALPREVPGTTAASCGADASAP